MQEGAAILENWKLAHFKYFKLKYFINEWMPGLDISTGI